MFKVGDDVTYLLNTNQPLGFMGFQ